MTSDAEIEPHGLVHHIEGNTEDPSLALAAIGALRVWLDKMEVDTVYMARIEGLSWQGIATMLRRSKQAVWEKYRNPGDSSDTVNV
jgi:glycyl-tRNA synthetase alpha subunit